MSSWTRAVARAAGTVVPVQVVALCAGVLAVLAPAAGASSAPNTNTTSTTVASSTTTTTTPSTTTTTTPSTTTTVSMPTAHPTGYWLTASDGGVYAYGTTNFGSTRGTPLNDPIVGGAATDSGLGYWLVGSDGGIFTFGDAGFHGSTGALRLNQPVVGMAADPATGGYWLVAADGGIFSFDAPFYGSTGSVRLNEPVVGMAATSDGKGYWLVARDGGIFSFGDAGFHGSTGSIRLNEPIVGMAADAVTGGYWMVASDGGIFSFDAPFFGSAGALKLVAPVVGMGALSTGNGYWLAARDGGIFTYGQAPFLGSAAANPGPAPLVAILATSYGLPFPRGGTGYDVSEWQCGKLPTALSFAVVQVSGGSISGSPNPCYAEEAAWAGHNMSAYIFLDGLPSPAPPESMTGPAGTCSAGNLGCEAYNYGWYWARHWVAYSRSLDVWPPLFWLDVEGPNLFWSSNTAENAAVVGGAVAGVKSTGVMVGVYSTSYQWPRIVGSLTFPGMLLWAAGADYLSGDAYSATSFCTSPSQLFAGGVVTLVQYGWFYPQGQIYRVDPDYACP